MLLVRCAQCFFGASLPFKILTIGNYEHTATLHFLSLSLSLFLSISVEWMVLNISGLNAKNEKIYNEMNNQFCV